LLYFMFFMLQHLSFEGNYRGEQYFVCKTVLWLDYGEFWNFQSSKKRIQNTFSWTLLLVCMCPNGRKSYIKFMLRKRNGDTGWGNTGNIFILQTRSSLQNFVNRKFTWRNCFLLLENWTTDAFKLHLNKKLVKLTSI
jgi:hypothetical protein